MKQLKFIEIDHRTSFYGFFLHPCSTIIYNKIITAEKACSINAVYWTPNRMNPTPNPTTLEYEISYYFKVSTIVCEHVVAFSVSKKLHEAR